MKLKLLSLIALCIMSCEAYSATTQVTTPTTLTQQNPTTTLLEKNKNEGLAFLNTNKSNKGVITLPNGMQYKVLTAGTGKKPTLSDVVEVNYEGRFIDGTVFDSSERHGTTATFPVSAVIPGWTQILQMMPVGSTWEVYIPSDLGYGDQGAPPNIEPGKTLIFKINLFSIKNYT